LLREANTKYENEMGKQVMWLLDRLREFTTELRIAGHAKQQIKEI